MRAGRTLSPPPHPHRDVEIRITRAELFSALSTPPLVIPAATVRGYDVVEEKPAGTARFSLYVRTAAGPRVLFYVATQQYDLALLLNELAAALPKVPRTWTKA